MRDTVINNNYYCINKILLESKRKKQLLVYYYLRGRNFGGRKFGGIGGNIIRRMQKNCKFGGCKISLNLVEI